MAVHATRGARIDPGTEQRDILGRAAGTGVAAADAAEIARLEPGLLAGLPRRDVLGRLAGLDDAPDDLDEPGLAPGGERTGAELLDQDNGVTFGIVKQYRDGIAPLEHLAHDLAAETTTVEAVAQAVAIEAEVAGESGFRPGDLDVGAIAGDAARSHARSAARARSSAPGPSGWP